MEMDKDEIIGTIVIAILGISFIVWLLVNPAPAEHCPEKQQVEHVRPHHKPAQSYKYGYDPIHHKFRWHWE